MSQDRWEIRWWWAPEGQLIDRDGLGIVFTGPVAGFTLLLARPYQFSTGDLLLAVLMVVALIIGGLLQRP